MKTRCSNHAGSFLFDLYDTMLVMPMQAQISTRPRLLIHDFKPLWPTWTSIIRPERANTVDDYQFTGSCAVIDNERHYLCDGMGLGKTKQIIDAQRYVYMKQPEKLQRYLTICKGGGVDSFADEYAKHFPEARVVKFNVGPKERKQLFNAALLIMNFPVVFLVGYEIFNRMIDDFASDTIWDWIVLDEAHKACSTPLNKTQSSVAKNIHRVHSRRQTAMSGTPIPDLPQGAFNVNLWLGFDDRSWNQFADETLKLISFSPSKNRPGFKLLKIVGYRQEGIKKLNVIANSGVMTRRTQEDELDLPPAIYQTRYVPLNDEERRRYDIIVGELVEQANGAYEQEHFVELADGVRKIVNPLNKFDRLIQVTSSIECHTGEKYESSKIRACIELMDEIGDQKLIVFSRFIPVLRGLYRAFKKYNPAYITGSTSTKAGKNGSDSERRLMEKKFQEDPTCRVFLGSTMACKEQMTLTAGTVVALIDRLWVPKLNDQAIARARRIGTTRTVTVVSFEAPNTVDQYVSARLKQKERTTDEIFDPKAFANEQMSIDQFIATLIP